MEKYMAPEMEIIEFDNEDVITTSLMSNGGSLGEPSGDGDLVIG